jgi:hypothetical protein
VSSCGRGPRVAFVAAVAALAILPASVLAHELDHPAPPPVAVPVPPATAAAGGPGAQWEFVDTIATGNPHTDIDFFTRAGNIYASVGTLAIGPNGGGQTIVQLTDGGTVNPRLIAQHPSASCISNPAAALGLQHDVEATPKGNAMLNTSNPFVVTADAELLIDATDAEGRCHDQGLLGLSSAPQGGLEIVDVTNPADPVEIGLVSHIGEAHTVNIDPKRPHIAYAVTSDSIAVNSEGQRQNENPSSSERFDLDGFEVVDLSTCMGFPAGTTIEAKRQACRPQVYRYRYPTTEMALGHTLKSAVWGCHELEVYPDDTLTCGSGNALIALDMQGAFTDSGTPSDFSDDVPNGTPLPCRVRPGRSIGAFQTGAMVTDCVDGQGAGTEDLTIPPWLAAGAPSLEGVQHLGSIHHQGRGAGGAATPAFDSTQDIDFNHETEWSNSGRLLLATDERGGGVQPPGATCSPVGDNTAGNGGVHFYRREGLSTSPPATSAEAFGAYARTPEGEKAIYRAPIRTQPRATVCTAHVFQQIPGQNRIFMGWYSQGTQVIDFVENPDGTVRFAEAGFFIPANSNEWVSHVFKVDQNADGSFTYWGATGDFNLGEAGRNAIDIWKVTLPPAPVSSAAPLPPDSPPPPTTPPGGSAGQAPGGRPPPGTGGPPDFGESGPCGIMVRGSNLSEALFGSIAGDTILGAGGADRIRARAGNDCVFGQRGRDLLRGGNGSDQLRGGLTRDRVVGGRGGDLIIERHRGRDRIQAGPGRDRINARGGGIDVVACNKGRDRAVVDSRDLVSGCEVVMRPAASGR